ncbi:transcriptional regulator [Microtetraspora sp. NBRC 13810]|uniref:IclR family transcriptional regulator n=1 Tax=Microtetraspora sp. NBRC 13810 TaxID=3030990 RepID=UPI0024A1BEF6|nr:IclR family transcriptional regulator [Microtetraspora sp. NBRC 13810]GLW13029.1 transcriptional regulator [Microtetraspora sp. NBRC 13810]
MVRTVPAVSRALDIMELFLRGETLSAGEITDRTGLPRTTVHELVTTLAGRSYLTVLHEQPTRYRLGMRLFQLGNVFAEQLDLAHEALLAAREVAARCAETVHVAVLEEDEVVYIAKVDSTHSVRMVSAVGRRLPAHCTGVGKMLLSGLGEEALDARYPPGVEQPGMTPNSITSPAALRAALARIREEDLAYDECESNDAVNCVAAPVRDQHGAMVAAMSISVPILRWDEQRRRAWTSLVREGARALSERLGHRPAPADLEEP